MAQPNGIRKRILAAMDSDPKQLWSVPDLMSEFPETTVKAIESHLRILRINGSIDRHINRDVNSDRQYAVKVQIEFIEVYMEREYSKTNSATTTTTKSYKKRSKLLTSREIRSMFAVHYNNMAKLEDSVMAIVDQFEAMEKEMNKIRNFLK